MSAIINRFTAHIHTSVMYMRGKLFFVLLMIVLCALISTACVRTINTPVDELRMYSWRGEYENGNSAELSFNGSNGTFRVTNRDFSFELSGLCVMTDDRMILCDDASTVNYSFGYRVHGDRVELTYNGSTLSLDKIT